MYDNSFQITPRYGHNKFIATFIKGDSFCMLDLHRPLYGPGGRFYSVETSV